LFDVSETVAFDGSVALPIARFVTPSIDICLGNAGVDFIKVLAFG
jgi:hypothetical protein